MTVVKYKLKKDDPVIVTAGKYKGVKSRVIRVLRDDATLLLENVNIVKRHYKPSQQHPEGGIEEKNLPIDISNVMYYCSKCKKGVKIGYKEVDGKKTRFCRSCGTEIK